MGLAGPGSHYGAGSSEGGPAWAAALRPPHHYNNNSQQAGLRLQEDRESVRFASLFFYLHSSELSFVSSVPFFIFNSCS
jgi:hypothetical protein